MKEILEEIGLTKIQTTIYLTLSKIGTATAYSIAKESGLFRANTYSAIKTLEDKGLVKRIAQKRVVKFEASDPSFLMDILDKKRHRLNDVLPEIRGMQDAITSESSFSMYKGTDALIRILYGFLDYNEPIYAYGVPKKAYAMIRLRIGHFHIERIKRKIRMIHIYNFEATRRIKELQKMPYTPVRCLPKLFDSLVSTNICGDDVLFIIWSQPIKIMKIKDKDMATAYKNYFKILWKNAT